MNLPPLIKQGVFVASVVSFFFFGNQVIKVKGLGSKIDFLESISNLFSAGLELYESYTEKQAPSVPATAPQEVATATPAVYAAAPKPEVPAAPYVRHVKISSSVEHEHSSALDQTDIPEDERIWRNQTASINLTERSGAKVHFFSARVVMFNAKHERLVDKTFDIPEFDLLPQKRFHGTLRYPTRILYLANQNWADDSQMLKIDQIYTLLVGRDNEGNEVLVNIENGDTRTHPLPYELHTFY